MTKRILFRGKKATTGTCKYCRGTIIITDPMGHGGFDSFHSDPACKQYLDIVANAETEDIVVVAESEYSDKAQSEENN